MSRSVSTQVALLLLVLVLSIEYSLAQNTASTSPSAVAMLRIETSPDSVQVTVNGHVAGVTPITLQTKCGDTLAIWLGARGFKDWSTWYVPSTGDTACLLVRLERENPTVSVIVDNPMASVLLDGKRISQGSILDHMTSIGYHRLVVSDDSSGRRAELKCTMLVPQRYFFNASLGTMRKERVMGAFLLPGSPHVMDGDYVTGSIMLVGNITLGYLAFKEQSDYTDCRDRYDLTMSHYVNTATDVEATRFHEELLDRKNDLDKAYTRKIVAFALFVGGYLYSVIDGLLHHSLGDVLQVVPLRDIPGLAFPTNASGVQVRMKF